ncbi:ANTAR domain-containing protein [Streptomyces sp. NPDC002701]|uniref:ANTAR domain-containing protein n=1 Tax=Streptomyces sp. NPDC002701 TaxID=3364661 RepID=UPI00369CEAC6
MGREEQIARTFVELADTLVDAFDVIDFLQQMTARCRQLLQITDAAVLLAHPGPRLHCAAPCDPNPPLQRVLDAALTEGPAVEAHRTAQPAVPGQAHAADDKATPRWPHLAQQTCQSGYALPSAVPMRLREEGIGALLLLPSDGRALATDDLILAQALADAATIGLLHARCLQEKETVIGQLRHALHSRIVIEQAKGILAARHDISLNDAFAALRAHARRHRTLLSKVAISVIGDGFSPALPSARPQDASDT